MVTMLQDITYQIIVCIPEINIMYVNYTSLKHKEEETRTHAQGGKTTQRHREKTVICKPRREALEGPSLPTP